MKRWVFGLMALAFALAGGTARAQQTFVVGVENISYTPYYSVEGGVYVGAAREILDAFAQDRGYRFDYRPLPVQRLFASLLGGQVDFKFPDAPYWQQALKQGKAVTYSGPVLSFVDGSMVPAGGLGLQETDVRSLGTVTGFTPFPWKARIEAGQVRVVENGSLEALVQQLKAGRLDAIYANPAVVRAALARQGDQPTVLTLHPGLPKDSGEYLLSTTKWPGVVKEFDSWLRDKADKVAAIRARHGIGN